jgi:hypothetical protein
MHNLKNYLIQHTVVVATGFYKVFAALLDFLFEIPANHGKK